MQRSLLMKVSIFFNSKLKTQNSKLTKSLLVVFFLFSISFSAFAGIEQKRERFLAINELIANKDYKQAQKQIKKVGDYVIKDYLWDKLYTKAPSLIKYKKLEHLIRKYKGSWLGVRFTYRYMSISKRDGHEKLFVKKFNHKYATKSMRCYYLKSLINLNKKKLAIEYGQKLWLKNVGSNKNCLDSFKWLIKQDGLDNAILVDKIIKLLEAKNYKQATVLIKKIQIAKLQNAIINLDDFDLLVKIINEIETMTKEEFVEHEKLYLYILQRFIKHLPHNGIKFWERINRKDLLNNKQSEQLISYACKQFQVRDEAQHCTRLIYKYPQFVDIDVIESKIRSALEIQDWLSVRNWIQRLPFEEQSKSVWRYWLLRANSQSDTNFNYSYYFKPLFNNSNYYGLLSQLHAGTKLSLSGVVPNHSKNERNDIKQLNCIQSSLELRKVGWHFHARQEWDICIKDWDEDLLYVAAEIGYKEQWPFASIEAMTYLSNKYRYHSLRFPVEFLQEFKKSAKHYNLDYTLLLGLARKESKFNTDVVSYSGAVGVLQLMPTTAKEMARKAKIPYKKEKLRDAEVNILLGSHYLREGIDRLDNNIIYAVAAYNVGIGRIIRWNKKNNRKQLPLDIWVETLPTATVRDYVKSVMLFSAIYSRHYDIEPPMAKLGKRWFETIDN